VPERTLITHTHDPKLPTTLCNARKCDSFRTLEITTHQTRQSAGGFSISRRHAALSRPENVAASFFVWGRGVSRCCTEIRAFAAVRGFCGAQHNSTQFWGLDSLAVIRSDFCQEKKGSDPWEIGASGFLDQIRL
jgi:hypothetical protein